MTTLAFDTLNYTKVLEEAGVPRAQAEAQARVQRIAFEQFAETNSQSMATKADVTHLQAAMKADGAQLQAAIRESELRVTVRLGGMIFALGGLLVAIKYFG